MAEGGLAADGSSTAATGKLTLSVIITCIMAGSGGLIFGYDIGISGGVTAMDSFLESFFPDVIRKRRNSKQNQYCVYDNQALTAFTSSLYIAGLFASLAAGRVTKAVGRQAVMLLGGTLFFIGAAVNAAAVNIEMLILGRILLGFGVGLINQATPVYLAEMAPSRWRGAFNTAFQFFIGIGVVVASLTNYATSRLPHWGWRLSLGLAAAPASVMLIGALFIPDTPSSLIQRGHIDAARIVLRRVRGTSIDIELELKEIENSVEISKVSEEGAFRRIVRRRYRPQLVMAVAIPMFQQLTGVLIVAFFSPVLFRTVGFGSDSALMGAVILGGVNLSSILVSTFLVDRCGRKMLFMQGGAQMIICQEYSVSSIKKRDPYNGKEHKLAAKSPGNKKDVNLPGYVRTPISNIMKKADNRNPGSTVNIPKHGKRVTRNEYEVEILNGGRITKRRKTKSTAVFKEPKAQEPLRARTPAARKTPNASKDATKVKKAIGGPHPDPANIGDLFSEGSLNPYADDPYAFD